MRTSLLFVLTLLISISGLAQKTASLQFFVRDGQQKSIAGATASLLRSKDSALVSLALSDTSGLVQFGNLEAGIFLIKITTTGFSNYTSSAITLQANERKQLEPVVLTAADVTMQDVTVTARRQLIELQPGKTIVNVDAGITNSGTSVMEALEKMPGVTVEKDGNISFKGRSGVLVLIDGKQTYLAPAQLASLLQGMSASQVNQVELITQPSARFDAAGNAGIINIKTKKNKQKGFNGTVTLAASQGFYPKGNNSLQLNYRTGKWNHFFNYSINAAQQFTRIYALRRYFKSDGKTVAAMLEQPTFFRGRGTTSNMRLGTDYQWSKKTSVGLTFSGTYLTRNSGGRNNALWMDANRVTDSLIETQSNNTTRFENGGLNLNIRHQFNANRELSADIDMLGYRIRNKQQFENRAVFPTPYSEASRAEIPSSINIISAKADYAEQIKALRVEGGWKSSHISTDNLANYQYLNGSSWLEDLGKSNHFLYNENIHALYGNAQTKKGKWDLQGGLRFELTHYDAKQLGNAAHKDSSFSRTYNGLFPTLMAGFEADSSNRFTLTAGRRIDRPAFQKLNPFLFVINKYTFQQGNPFYLPQYTWNVELEHQYKGKLITGLSYSITTDYFSQIFPVKENGIILYTEGNLDKLQTWGASLGVQLAPARWWSLNAQAVYNYKKMQGFIGRYIKADISQLTMNMNNQFRFSKGWSGEITGFFTSRSQHDIQEVVDPAGQLSAGVAKNVLQNKGSVKFAVRDILYTQWMKGNTYFQQADEYFKLTRDTRVATLTFTYRFGKAGKASRRSEGAAGEEKARVGTGS